MNIKIFRSVLFIAAFFLFANFAWAEDWVLYESGKTGNRYYDKSSIKDAGNNIISVWVIKVYNKDGKAKDFSMLQNKKKAPANADVLSLNSVLTEIDCAKKKIMVSAWTIYDNNKKNIYTAPKSITKWQDIVAKSSTEKLRTMVCGSTKPSKGKKK